MKATIVIPTYNVSRYVRATLDSVIQDADDEIEILVIDDGSSDDTLSIVQGYGPRVRWFHQANQGAAAARNKGIELSTGEIIFFLDSDDVVFPGKFASALEVFAQNPHVGMVFTNLMYIDSAGNTLNHDVLDDYPAIRQLGTAALGWHVLPKESAHLQLIASNYISTSGVAIPRRVLDEIGGFKPDYYCGEDWDLWMRVTERFDIAYVPKTTHAYRLHPDMTSASNPERVHTSQIAGLVEHMNRSTNEQFRQHAVKKIADSCFSLAYFYYSKGRMAQARAMLRRAAVATPMSRIAPAWLKTWLGASITSWLRDKSGRAKQRIQDRSSV